MPDKSYQCLVVDDEELGRDLIAAHLGQLPQFDVVAMCASAIEATQYLNEHSIDLLFLDIEMPVLKGTEFYRGLSDRPKVIFTTAHRDYALDGFDLEAVDYLLKPVTFARFFKAIERFLNQQARVGTAASNTGTARDYLFVRADRKEVKVHFRDLLYVKGLKDYVEVHTSQSNLLVKSSLSSFLRSLPDGFV